MKPVTPATQVRKARKADPVGALLREKLRDERNGTGMVAVRGAEVTLAQSKAGLRDEMEDEEDGSSSDSESEYVRRSTKGKGRMSSPAGPSRTQKAKRKDDDGSEDDEEEKVQEEEDQAHNLHSLAALAEWKGIKQVAYGAGACRTESTKQRANIASKTLD